MSKRRASANLTSIRNTGPFSTKQFQVGPSHRYQGRSPVYKQPVEINSYSIDHDRKVWFDNRELKYYYAPSGKDLTVGFDRFIQRDETVPEHLDTLLDALTDAKAKANVPPEMTQANIVTWRGIMTKLLCTPYARNEPWELRLTRYKDTIYIEEEATQKKKDQEANASVRQQMMCYWGYRFETLCTVSSPPSTIAESDPELTSRLTDSANTNVQYCVLVRTTLGKNSLIMGAEVDCIRGNTPRSHEP
ncbi:hypothetical protein DM01DRAFT_1295045 [Hesseltinella vesiculosa]|uniref:Decapping nuclease n=1 Tax=Hesseltinella vesiculosa TaxID=101127 RepID=A0A1X2G4M3_9FUNG|nr:hypothetical protein DM01DRAFT_1295045 [Hesseltinella vesiculosa]